MRRWPPMTRRGGAPAACASLVGGGPPRGGAARIHRRRAAARRLRIDFLAIRRPVEVRSAMTGALVIEGGVGERRREILGEPAHRAGPVDIGDHQAAVANVMAGPRADKCPPLAV